MLAGCRICRLLNHYEIYLLISEFSVAKKFLFHGGVILISQLFFENEKVSRKVLALALLYSPCVSEELSFSSKNSSENLFVLSVSTVS